MEQTKEERSQVRSNQRWKNRQEQSRPQNPREEDIGDDRLPREWFRKVKMEHFRLSGGSRSYRAEAAVLGLGARKCQGQHGI